MATLVLAMLAYLRAFLVSLPQPRLEPAALRQQLARISHG
jgi:hypothetical protein